VSLFPRCTCPPGCLVFNHVATCPRHFELHALDDAPQVGGVTVFDAQTLANRLKNGPCDVPSCFVCNQESA
jgi:hypothetical protein